MLRGGVGHRECAPPLPDAQTHTALAQPSPLSLFRIPLHLPLTPTPTPCPPQEGRPVLCIAVGMRGMVPIRALLSWTPMLAHATARKVSCLYVERAPTTAGFVVEWDKWREAGIGLHTTYLGEDGDLTDEARVMEALDSGLFLREGGFNSLAGSASECLVVMAGLTGVQASNVCKRLGAKGVRHERMLFADFF